MHRAILCIGSNFETAAKLIEDAVTRLSRQGVNIVSRSDIYTVSLPYYNCVTDVSTSLDKASLVTLTKNIETRMGRTAKMKAMSLVPIDIDIVIFDGVTLRPADFSADYFRRGYASVKNCVGKCPDISFQ